MKLRKLFITICASTALLASSAPVEDPLWLRYPSLSPDGSMVAFTYKGDIYTVASRGGAARRLTGGTSYNTRPIWSPDGSKIVFSSDREGSADIYIVDATGGTPLRLTTHSDAETPLAFLNDSTIIYSAKLQPDNQSAVGGFQAQTYTVSTTPGSRSRMFMSIPVMNVSVDGNKILYQDRKGYEDVLRKHEHSSGTADIWLLTLGQDGKPAKGDFKKLTDFDGQNQNPVWKGTKSDSFYYLNEEDGTSNVYSASLDGKAKTQLTWFETHPVRHLTSSADGTMLAFSWNGRLYTLIPGSEPKRLDVEITEDFYSPEKVKTLQRSGASSIAISPSGDEIAFVLRGNVYVTSTDYTTTKQITDTPEQERVVDFSPDGRMLVYDSERDGRWQLFTAEIVDPNEKQFAYATEIKEKPLYKAEGPAFQPAFSPDGKRVAFLEDRTTLKVIDLKSKKVTTALHGDINYSYTDGDIEFRWSPDSKWFLTTYMANGGWNNPDIALVAADGSKTVDLTQSGYADQNPHWVLDGAAMTWESDRNGFRSHGSWGSESDIYIMFFDGEAYDKFQLTEEEEKMAEKAKSDSDNDDKGKKDEKKDVKPLKFDLDNAKYRVARLTDASAVLGEHYLDKDGKRLFYVTDGNLVSRNIREGDKNIVMRSVDDFEPSDDGSIFIVRGRGALTKFKIDNGSTDGVDYEAPLAYNAAAEREYIFNHMLKQVKDKFYDENLHGVDWDSYGEAYRQFLPHINNNYDYAEMLSEILGELNASHTGGRYNSGSPSMHTANLGAFFDEEWNGDGLLVAEVLKGGPLSGEEANITPGDIIVAIDGEKIKAGKDYYPLLEGKAGRKVRLTVSTPDGQERTVYVKPAGGVGNLVYSRWVERNRAYVDSISDGRIGYVHVRGMDSPSYRTVFEEMLGRHRNCDAIVVDTRFNGGGWLHNDLAVLLAGKEYVRYTPRGRYIGSDPFTQWTKPSVMLVNEGNYSDGHGAAFTYQTLGLGDVVGAPIPGTMTAVWWERQIDPSLVFGIPQTTSSDLNGIPMENHQLNPDVLIYNDPADVLNGYDAQLEGAVRHLLEKVGKKDN